MGAEGMREQHRENRLQEGSPEEMLQALNYGRIPAFLHRAW
jgi:hypothetical protein